MVRRLSCKTLVHCQANRLSRGERQLCAIAGLGLLVLLATVAGLVPQPVGAAEATHQQLGLPPCRFQSEWQMRCPSCGMTTAWAYAVRGRLPAAFASNVAGALLALVAMAAAPWMMASAWLGRWCWLRWHWGTALVAASLLWAIAMADWLVRLALD